MKSPYTNIGNGSRNCVQASFIIKLVSSYLSSISMKAFYLLIGALLMLLVEDFLWIKLMRVQET